MELFKERFKIVVEYCLFIIALLLFIVLVCYIIETFKLIGVLFALLMLVLAIYVAAIVIGQLICWMIIEPLRNRKR